MTNDFVAETIFILALIFLAGLVLGLSLGKRRKIIELLSDTEDEAPSRLGDRFFYLLSPPRYHELRICEMRCERNDRKRSTIVELTGTEG